MEIIHIGGEFDGGKIDPDCTSQITMYPLKRENDFASDPQHVDTYEQHTYLVRNAEGDIFEMKFRVLIGMSMEEFKSIVRARHQLEIQPKNIS